jgi:hypothetical protein
VTGAVAPPRRLIPWQPPEANWAGRALFFTAGAAVCVVSFAAVAFVVERDWVASAHAWGFALPLALTVAAFLQRRWRGPRWRWGPFGAGAILLPVACWGALAAMPWVGRRIHARPFDAVVWRRSADPSDRPSMIHDLLDRHPLVGCTRSEVEALLGPPSIDHGWSARRGVGRSSYFLCQPVAFFGFATGYWLLEVRYDRGDRVVALRLE